MKSTTKVALVAGAALTLALAGAAVNARPDGWGPGAGYGIGAGHMGYGMGAGHMGYGMGPGGMGFGMGGGHMGYGMGSGYGMGLSGMLHGYPDAVTERLDALNATLGITDTQRDAWGGFAESIKKQAEDRLAWFNKMHAVSAPRTTPEWLAQRDAAMKQQQADMQAVTTAVRKLYDVLTPEQRALLDQGPFARGPRYGAR